MRTTRWGSTVLVAGMAAAAIAATSGHPRTGTTRDEPLAEDVCPEEYPELDPADPVGTLYPPAPAPGRDLCAAWVTADWDGHGPDAELRFVTFGLRTLGDVELRSDRSFAFTWDVPTAYDTTVPLLPDDGSCATTMWVSDGTVLPSVSFRACGSPMVDYLVGGRVPARVTVDGSVLEVRIRAAGLPTGLAGSFRSGNTLWSLAAVSYLPEPWADDVTRMHDVTFVPPEEPSEG